MSSEHAKEKNIKKALFAAGSTGEPTKVYGDYARIKRKNRLMQ